MKELEKRFEVVRGLLLMYNGMTGLMTSDYGAGIQQGMISTLRALGIEDDFNKYLAGRKEEKDGDDTILSDRVE